MSSNHNLQGHQGELIVRQFGIASLLILCAFNAHSVQYDNFLHETADHFKHACLDNEFSQASFEAYYRKTGATVRSYSSGDFIASATNPKGFLGTLYRKPFYKCCASVWNRPGDAVNHVGLESFVYWMMQYLPLGEPRLATEGQKKLVLFKPRYGNRLLSIDRDKGAKGEALNLCRSEYAGAEAEYYKHPLLDME